MVSGEKVWDPLSAGLLQPRLSEQHPPAGLTPLCDHRARHATRDGKFRRSQRPHRPRSSLSPTAAAPDDLCQEEAQTSAHGLPVPAQRPLCGFHAATTSGPYKPSCLGLGVSFRPVPDEEEGEAEQLEMKGKSRQGGRGEAPLLDDQLEDMADGPKNAKITLSFPLSAAPLPAALTSPNHCRASSSSSSSPHRRRPSSSGSKGSDEGSLWKLDATMDVKHRSFKPPRHDSSPSSSPSSSSSPMTANSHARKDIKSPPPLKCSKVNPETQFGRFPPRSSSGLMGGCYSGEGREERHRLANGTTTASPSQTAQILFNLGAVTYQGQRGGDAERKEKTTGRPSGKVGSPHNRPNLQPPTLHLPPPPLTLPPSPHPAEAPAHSSSSSSSPADGLKPELICGVCHRLFSSASSLTAHMRLHRGTRALSCRYCGKAFIHNKRLQSHEGSCGAPPPGPLSSLQLKEEPLEEGEVRVEGGVIVGSDGAIGGGGKARLGKKERDLLARIHGGGDEDEDAALTAELLAGSENHFVKVVDGTVIYFCSVCERSYMTLSSLKRHSNVHSWRRKYPCHFCDKVFALAEYRTKHEVWHTGERRYQCIFCWDAFATYYNLKTHQKTIHGISPGLISSEKTANGGYKQKVNALKLYRLLPMRSQKRPYKTYSDGLSSDGMLLAPADPSSSSLPLGLDLQGLIDPQSMKPDPDAFPDDFPVTVGAAKHGNLSTLTPLPQTDTSQVRRHDGGAPEESEQGRSSGGFNVSSSSKTKTPKSVRGTETGTSSSVITYGHTKPSVIVHGTAVSSSVIVHSNQVTSGGGRSPPSSPSPKPSDSQSPPKASPRSIRKQRESADGYRKRSRDNSDAAEEGGARGRQDAETGRSHHKSHKAHSKSDTFGAKQPSASQAKGAGPLCQITVRIGEEAMVKRSISETDLRRDKRLEPPKAKRNDASSPRDAKEPRHSHSHHHHKHRAHRSASLGAEEDRRGGGGGEGEDIKKSPKSPDKVREYYFRQEVREQGESDHDTEDNLWRPYYSYKPKRKAQAQLQRAKSWQRKLQYKRSLRLMRRAERLMNHVSKETVKRKDDEEEEEEQMEEVEEEEEEEEVAGLDMEAAGEVKEISKERGEGEINHPSVSSKEIKNEQEHQQTEGGHANPPTPPLPSPLSTSAPPPGIKRRPWTNGNAAECGTCGRWFSSPRKRDKHELSHLLEFVCLFCRATFPSRDKLEDHQRAQHPRPAEPPPLPPRADLISEQGEGPVCTGTERGEEEEREGPHARSTSSPSRLSRRALARHTCPQCHKVCKTSSALTRHVRRHELSSSPEREEEVRSEPKVATETIVGTVSKDLETETEQVPTAQSVPVISYSPSDPTANGSCREPEQCESQRGQLRVEQHMSESYDRAKTPELASPSPEREPNLPVIKHPLDSPVNLLTPTKPEIMTAAPSTLQSVLVMSGSECLDYRTPRKRNLDSQVHSPVRVTTPANACPAITPVTSQTRIINTAPPAVSMTTAPSPEAGFMKREGVIMDRGRGQGATNAAFLRATSYEEPPSVRDLPAPPPSRSPSPDEAQDLTMSSMLAREREMEREMERRRERERQVERERERQREREREAERAHHQQRSRVIHPAPEELALLVPKEEPLSPAPSPQHMPCQTTINRPSSPRRPPKSPCRSSPAAMELLAQVCRQGHLPSQGPDRLPLPMGASSGVTGDRPSAHALLLPRAPPQQQPAGDSRLGGEAASGGCYPVQDFPLPLIVPGGYRSGKKQERGEDHHRHLLMSSYPAGGLPFGPLGKVMVPGGGGGDLAKLPFYHDPYQLLYGPQLLAYPYNLAALPVALNMMAPGGDKVDGPLPFLPALFNYAAAAAAAAAAGPYMSAVPHPLVANPSHYSSSSGGSGNKKQRDSSKP